MDSENLIFLTLFFSLVLSLWSWTSLKPNQPFLVPESINNPNVGLSSCPPVENPSFQGRQATNLRFVEESSLPVAPIPCLPSQGLQEYKTRAVGGIEGDLASSKSELRSNNSFKIIIGSFLVFQNKNLGILLSSVFVFGANLLLSFLLLSRWIESGHPPFSNLYESLLFLAWSLLFLYFPTMGFWGKDLFKTKNSIKVNFDQNPRLLLTPNPAKLQTAGPELSSLAGIVLVSAALFIYTFATWVLPSEMREIQPLVPALKSNWLLMHVSIMLLSYSALIAGSLFSILYLVLFYSNKTKSTDFTNEHPVLETLETPKPNNLSKQRFLNDLDSLSYRSLAFAFPLLTLGIISGAVWANEAWGSYWSWDPKETWALITWFIFSIYLHLRIQKAWEGERAALVATFGFFVVWVCYLGVNLLGKGLHSYGWWNS